MKELLEKAESVRKEIKEYLIENLDKLNFIEVDSHYVVYSLTVGEQKYPVRIWTANTKEFCKFYDHFAGIDLDYGDYSPEEIDKMWNKAMADKNQTGEKRNITKAQMRNDLYFSFKGIFDLVKFSGYDDNDWWTKHRPKEVKETEEIVWQIDLDTMTATYKPKA